MKREYIAYIALFLVTLLNTVTHFTHPAYRYYKQVSKSLKDETANRQENFEKKVIGELLPAIYQAITNNAVRVSRLNNSVFDSASTLSQVASKDTRRIVERLDNARYYRFGGCPFIEYNGMTFNVGDVFDGSQIVSISPLLLRTQIADYTLSSKNFTAAQQHSIEFEKGGNYEAD